MSTATAELLSERRNATAHRLRSLVRGRAEDPAWVRPALFGLLAATACLYLVDLAASGYAKSFYSAAVQAGSKSWKAFFFGSFDSSNFITVDKPPAALWVMDISARLFGVNSWSILVPQALEGIASVGLLYVTVRRRFSASSGLIAGAALALTPVAALMFRFNNPDALLTLLLVGAAYAVTRALEGGSSRWLVLAGVLVGFGFLTKMLQALIVVPGFAAVYLIAAPVSVRRRFAQLLASGVALFLAAAWWVAAVALWPASSRPYIGGSQNNSILDLIFGYNGFGRLTGNETGSVVGGHVFGTTGTAATAGLGGGAGGQAGGSMWGPTGITRLFGSEMGTQISWLLPAALLFVVVLLVGLRRARRTDGRRAAVLIWGSWLVVTGLVFSFAQGIIHPYYTVALAPAIGALVGIGVTWTWERRTSLLARLSLAAALAMTAMWSYVLLDRTPTWHPALRYGIVFAGLATAALVAAGPPVWGRSPLVRRAILLAALAAALAAPAAYSAQTATTAETGSLPAAGPAGSVSGAGAGAGGRGGFGPGCAGASPRARRLPRRPAPRPPGNRQQGRHRQHRRSRRGSSRHGRGRHGSGGSVRRPRHRRRCTRRPPRLRHPERGARHPAPEGSIVLQLGRRSRRREQRRGYPARDRRPGDGDRRLQRDGPMADPRGLQGRRRGRKGALRPRRVERRSARRRRVERELERDRELGRGDVRLEDSRRRDALRPHLARRLLRRALRTAIRSARRTRPRVNTCKVANL